MNRLPADSAVSPRHRSVPAEVWAAYGPRYPGGALRDWQNRQWFGQEERRKKAYALWLRVFRPEPIDLVIFKAPAPPGDGDNRMEAAGPRAGLSNTPSVEGSALSKSGGSS